jgi:4-amino-4-deoxy-L-arabinose transferase-like glycosyltransferase
MVVLRRLLKPPTIIVVVALLFRLALILALDTYHFDPARDHYRFGREFGRVARSIASGQGFGSPFHGPSGPTAILPPVYPYVLAGVFRLFGIYSALSGFATLTLQSLSSALTCLVTFYIGEKSFSRTVGKAAAWVFAFNPFGIYISVEWVWETALSTLLVSLVFLETLYLQHSTRRRDWLAFGLLCALTALTNPAVIAALPFLGLWLWRWLREQRAHPGPLIGTATLVFLLSATPWLGRNYLVFHQVIPFRSNFGLELRLGNYPDGMGTRALAMHPSQNNRELEKYRRMGEIAYIAEKKREAIQFIARHPRTFLKLTVLRFLMWWTGEEWKIHGTSRLAPWGTAGQIFGFGMESALAFMGLALAARTGNRHALLYAIFLVCYPLAYYVTFPELRFRHPLEPIMTVLCVYALRCAFYGHSADLRAPALTSSGATHCVEE